MTARAAKAAETRERIARSAAALYREHLLGDITLEAVADRAETTVQTILRIFGSKEGLMHAAIDRSALEGTPITPTAPGDVRAAVHAVFDIYETVGDFVIARLAQEHRSPALKQSLDRGRRSHEAWVRTAFAPLLEAKRGAARTQLYTIIMVATDVYVWKLMRRDLALKRDAAEAAVRAIITGINEAEGTDGKTSVAQLVGRR